MDVTASSEDHKRTVDVRSHAAALSLQKDYKAPLRNCLQLFARVVTEILKTVCHTPVTGDFFCHTLMRDAFWSKLFGIESSVPSGSGISSQFNRLTLETSLGSKKSFIYTKQIQVMLKSASLYSHHLEETCSS